MQNTVQENPHCFCDFSFLALFSRLFLHGQKVFVKARHKGKDRGAQTHICLCQLCVRELVRVFVCFVWVICAKTDLGPEVTLLCAPVVHMD